MLQLIASLGLYALTVWAVDLSFGAAVLGLGFGLGWYCRRGTPPAAEADRARQAVKRLQDLATSVANDVGEHSTRVRAISTGLNPADNTAGSEWDEMVLGSVSEIIKANERLQDQLATAEVRLQRQAAELETQVAVARTDALTDLHNRRAFDDELSRRFAEWQRRKTVFSLLMIDVDRFKQFNDQHGHRAGDQVLRDVAAALATTMREMDLVTRYGGEEFAVILPVTNLADSLRAAERARAAVESSLTQFAGAQLRVTTSVGVAQVSPGDTPEGLVQRADEALYKAKGAGRNRVWFHDSGRCLPADEASGPAQADSAAAPAPVQTTVDSRSLTAFCTELRRRVLDCKNCGLPLSLILLDIDDFKARTSQTGSAVRELVLETLSEFLAGSLDKQDILSRYGEGRFAIMLPGSDQSTAASLGERVRTAIAGSAIQIQGTDLRFTTSLGLAQAQPNDDPSSLIRRADAALFAAKAAGGNSANLHNGTTFEPLPVPALAP